jgi:hypothetical protein
MLRYILTVLQSFDRRTSALANLYQKKSRKMLKYAKIPARLYPITGQTSRTGNSPVSLLSNDLFLSFTTLQIARLLDPFPHLLQSLFLTTLEIPPYLAPINLYQIARITVSHSFSLVCPLWTVSTAHAKLLYHLIFSMFSYLRLHGLLFRSF